jgi:hypothetical protein
MGRYLVTVFEDSRDQGGILVSDPAKHKKSGAHTGVATKCQKLAGALLND